MWVEATDYSDRPDCYLPASVGCQRVTLNPSVSLYRMGHESYNVNQKLDPPLKEKHYERHDTASSCWLPAGFAPYAIRMLLQVPKPATCLPTRLLITWLFWFLGSLGAWMPTSDPTTGPSVKQQPVNKECFGAQWYLSMTGAWRRLGDLQEARNAAMMSFGSTQSRSTPHVDVLSMS